jgi:hypothetical protein
VLQARHVQELDAGASVFQSAGTRVDVPTRRGMSEEGQSDQAVAPTKPKNGHWTNQMKSFRAPLADR